MAQILIRSRRSRAQPRSRRCADAAGGFDVSLFNKRIFDADVAIEVDQAGNIRVLTRGESLRERGGPGELRVLRAVNVFDLAQARDTCRMTFSLSVTHRQLVWW